jgi:hypothetical protein
MDTSSGSARLVTVERRQVARRELCIISDLGMNKKQFFVYIVFYLLMQGMNEIDEQG